MCLELLRLRRGSLAIGLCLKLLVLGALGTWGAFEVADQVNKWRLQPTLKLSAVFHGAQSQWCYLEPSVLKGEQAPAFKTFVVEQLSSFITQSSYFPNQGRLEVTWQATPHNQCQFIFQNLGDRMSVERRRFSQTPTITPHGQYFKVKDILSDLDSRQDRLEKESLGELKGITEAGESTYVTFDQILSALHVTAGPPPASLAPDQRSFLEKTFSPVVSSAIPATPVSQRSDFKNRLMQWVYGDQAEKKQQVYRERRD